MISLVLFALGSVSVAPSVQARSAILMDYETGKVLWSREADVPMAPASTTKVMTALLLLERTKPDAKIVADKECELVDGASLRLNAGEWLSSEDALWAMMLRSANDVCEAAAKHISGSVPKFVELMNERARELGCQNTAFANPHGLPDPKHLSSAHDLGLIARAAMNEPAFRAVVKNRRHKIERSKNMQDAVLVSKNKFLRVDASADGIKTGYTREAGHCFIGSATRNGHRLITVVLNSSDWVTDTAALTSWGFRTFERTVLARAGTRAELVQGYGLRTVAVNKEAMIAISRRGAPKPTIAFTGVSTDRPLAKGEAAGEWNVTDQDGFNQRIPAVASEASGVLPAPRTSPSSLAILGFMGAGLYFLKSKSRKLSSWRAA